jgi:hypothetical protein
MWFNVPSNKSAAARSCVHADSLANAKARIQLTLESVENRKAEIIALHKQADVLHALQDDVDAQLDRLHARL